MRAAITPACADTIALSSTSATASLCSAYRRVVCMFLCPKRFRLVSRPTPPLTSSVAWPCRSWCSVQETPTRAQYPAHSYWTDWYRKLPPFPFFSARNSAPCLYPVSLR